MLKVQGFTRLGRSVPVATAEEIRIEGQRLAWHDTCVPREPAGWLLGGTRSIAIEIEGTVQVIFRLLSGGTVNLGRFRSVSLDAMSLVTDVGQIATFSVEQQCWDLGNGQCAEVVLLHSVNGRPAKAEQETRRERIAFLAYQKAARRGFAPGGELADWLSAEQEIDRSIH